MAQSNGTDFPGYLRTPGLQPRLLRIVGIGAGASGLLLAYKVQRNFRNFDLKIFEKNAGPYSKPPHMLRGKINAFAQIKAWAEHGGKTIILGLSDRVLGYKLLIVDPTHVGVRVTTFLTTTPIPLSPKQITRRRTRLPRKSEGKRPVPQAPIAAVFLSMSN